MVNYGGLRSPCIINYTTCAHTMERVKRCTCTGIHCVNCTDFRGKNSSYWLSFRTLLNFNLILLVNLEKKNTYFHIFLLIRIRRFVEIKNQLFRQFFPQLLYKKLFLYSIYIIEYTNSTVNYFFFLCCYINCQFSHLYIAIKFLILLLIQS